ncbi:MAG TPA: Ig-like domain-containing protein [Candidatus Dormibacteraeota bacterium]|nr:Ig-like domain-containing protein [Candidatus Dormibacteraeota bacterium]
MRLCSGIGVAGLALVATWPSLGVRAGATYVSSYAFVSAAGDYIGQGATASYGPNATPGLDVYGEGRGCNMVYGQFTINAIGSDASGNITLLDATFTQNCEQPTAPPLNGTVKYQVPVVSSTSTALTAQPSTSAFGTPVRLTAGVTPSAGAAATGTVTFLDGSAVVGSAAVDATGAATLTTSALGIGTHSITASYGGDTGDTSSTSAPASVTVTADPTATSLSSSSPCSRSGQAVTFSTGVTSPAGAPTATGSVRFLDGSRTLATATLGSAGTTTLTTAGLSIGSHAITASYLGDATHATSTSGTVIQTVVRKHC